MNTPASYISLIAKFNAQPQSIKRFFPSFVDLVQDYEYQIVVAYCFFRLEQAYNRILYGGARKKHKANSTVLSNVLDKQHLTREGFLSLFVNVFGVPVTDATKAKIKFSEKIRDRIIHGKHVPDSDARKCLSNLLDFMTSLETEVRAAAPFSPFGDLRGLTGQSASLDASTTKWLLKGMGFAVA